MGKGLGAEYGKGSDRMVKGMRSSKEVLITIRHGARLDINAQDDAEVEKCGGKHEFDTPLCFLGHE